MDFWWRRVVKDISFTLSQITHGNHRLRVSNITILGWTLKIALSYDGEF